MIINNMAKFSIIVPCFNQDEYLGECLQSVYNQTYKNWECIIVNDGSTDNSAKIALSWTKKDSRFKYFHHENKGVAAARNKGLDIATGEWIQLLDGDDLLVENKLFDSEKHFSEGYNFVYTDFSVLNNQIIEPPFCNLKANQLTVENLIKLWDNGMNVPIHSPVFAVKLINNLRFNENFQLFEDWLFWLQLFNSNKVNAFFIDERLVLYRNHLNSNTKNIEKLATNILDVYKFTFENLLSVEQQNLLFNNILAKYTHLIKKSNFMENVINRMSNSKAIKFRNIFYKIFNK